jgi:hypothetical protein
LQYALLAVGGRAADANAAMTVLRGLMAAAGVKICSTSWRA